jgi:tRNA 2-thiouridine synthesizing protein A
MALIMYDLELDVRGTMCPMPMATIGRRIYDVEVGQVVKVLATDPACMADIPAWARVTENEMLSAEMVDQEYELYVRRLR